MMMILILDESTDRPTPLVFLVIVGTWSWLDENVMADVEPKAVKRDAGMLAEKAAAVGTVSPGDETKTETAVIAEVDEAKMEMAGAASKGGEGAKQAPADSNSELKTRVVASTSMEWYEGCSALPQVDHPNHGLTDYVLRDQSTEHSNHWTVIDYVLRNRSAGHSNHWTQQRGSETSCSRDRS